MATIKQWMASFKRTAAVRFVRGLWFDGSTVRKAEPEVWRFVGSNARWVRGACVDVGANRGEFTALMAREMGATGIVYAFELHPDNVRLLRSNLWRYRRRVRVENLAVTDGATETVGVLPGRNRSAAEWKVAKKVPGERENPEFYSSAISLDQYFPPGVSVELVKIDVEGAGHQVLAGMQRILGESRPVIVCEVHNGLEWEGLKRLEEAGYALFDLQGAKLPGAREFVFHCAAVPAGRQVTFGAPS